MDGAKADVRRLDRATAMQLFESVLHFSRTGGGDLKSLQGELAGAYRLRHGDYQILFTLSGNEMRIFGVLHRSEAYR